MIDPLGNTEFLPHGVCLAWDPNLLSAMVGAEVLLGISYVSVACTLVIFSRRRPDFPYPRLMLLLALVFASCGVSHFTDVATLWVPAYMLQVGFKAVVALFSVPAAALMWMLLPRALELPSPASLRDANASLATAKEAAEHASRAKSNFLATMSHELRTPLNAVIGFADVLQMQMFGPLNGKQAEYVAAIRESGRHLLHLINDILDITKIDAGRVELEEGPVSLFDVVQSCVALEKGHAAEGGVDLVVDRGPAIPLVSGDALRLKQVVLNLLSNAVKFTPKGGRVSVAIGRDDDGGIVLTVADTGIGMDPGEIPRAFEMFTQIGDAMARSHGGTGVGLPLTKALVDLHGGHIAVASAPGKGTTVRVSLPPSRILA
ncbi:MAG: sensor histidine kinase [Solirubrobacterales bacterium]